MTNLVKLIEIDKGEYFSVGKIGEFENSKKEAFEKVETIGIDFDRASKILKVKNRKSVDSVIAGEKDIFVEFKSFQFSSDKKREATKIKRNWGLREDNDKFVSAKNTILNIANEYNIRDLFLNPICIVSFNISNAANKDKTIITRKIDRNIKKIEKIVEEDILVIRTENFDKEIQKIKNG